MIPIFDILTSTLDKFIDDETCTPAVRAAALRGLSIMNKYYALTDESIVHRIAIILHPRYKTTYFSKARWPRAWIDTAVSIFRAEWETNYEPTQTAKLVDGVASSQVRYQYYFMVFVLALMGFTGHLTT